MQSEITNRCIACGTVLRSELAGAQCSTCLLRLATTDSVADPSEPLLQSGVLPRFDDYEIEAEIASGGMGVVYRAMQLSLKRPVAIKTIIGGHLATPESIARFRSEAEAAARLDHPGIIPIYEVGEHQTQQFLSMKLIEGGSLEDRISEFSLSLDLAGAETQERQIQIAKLMLAIADATEHAHERGVLHRDIKPSNVLIDNTGQPYLTDFGLAKLLGDDASAQTVAGGVIGSPSYMAPEQATCKVDEITIAADVYGLGATLYRLLTDQPPFTGPTPMATVRSVVDDAPTPPRSINPRISRDLETVTLKCLRKKPNARYRSAAELADELRKFIEGRPIEARPVSTMEHVWRWSQRNPMFAGLLASLFIVTTVGLAATTWKWKEAVFERKQADTERDNAEWQSYFAQMQVVSASLELKQPQRAAQALALTPTHLRGWEYAYFSARLNQSRGPFGRFERGSWLVRFTSSGRRIFLQDHQKTSGAMHDMLTGKEEHQHVLINPTGTHFAMPHDSGTQIVSELGQAPNVIETPFERVLAIGDEGERVVTSSSDMVQIIDARNDRIQCSIEMKPHRVHRSVLRGNRLLTATIRSAPKGTILTLWNTSTGERIGEMENASRYLFSGDGKNVIFGTMEPDNELKIWDVSSGDAWTFENRVNEKVIEMAISPDARLLATAEFDDVVLHDLREQTIIARLEDHTDLVHSLRFSRDGAKLASGSDDRTIRVWDAKTGKPLRTLTGATQPLRSLSFSPDDRWLASSGWETGFRLWNLDTPPDSLQLGGALSYVAAHPDGDRIVVTGSDGTVRIYSNLAQSLDTIFTCEDGGILRAAFSPDGKLLAFQVEYFRDTAECNALYIWDFENNQLLHNITVPRVVQYCNVAFSPDSSLLAAGSQDGIVRIWRPQTGDLVASLGEPGAVNRHVSFSPNGKLLSSIYHDEVRVWDIARQELVGNLRGHEHFIYDAKFSPDGKLIASASHDHTVRLWDTGEWSQFAVLPLSHHALCLSFTPDGTRLAVGGRDTGVHLWDVQHARQVATLYGHKGSVNGVAFSPDGTRLYTASSDGTARVWDTTRASLD